ncbi:hypothetical protein L7F22_011198 [Adiantum nelumboides]|nr:hypothetical protein [Adiantum nelumboides]
MSGSGTVANVTLRQPSAPGATVSLHGRFEILALAGAFFPGGGGIIGGGGGISGGITISLAGAQGQVVGGSVVGALTAAGPVLIVAASFLNPLYERLPLPPEEEQAGLPASQHNLAGAPPNTLLSGQSPDSSSMPLFSPSPLNCHLPQEMLAWASSSAAAPARPPF